MKKLKWSIADGLFAVDNFLHKRARSPRWFCDMQEARFGVPGAYGRMARWYVKWLHGHNYYPSGGSNGR